ncbi:MAG: FKBP-type peptidyl-prolyl cis-trans isomerase [Cyclobacteriaceae bacterium]|nr:FKBP-type peptidyl-prolyl cis-trans isomerase [Cyclobacteriaceae bacterium]
MSQLVSAQSKKELKAEVIKLKAEVENLSTELDGFKNPPKTELSNEHLKASYGLGILMGSNLKKQGSDSLIVEVLNEGMRDALKDLPKQMNEEEAMAIVQPYMNRAMEREIEALKKEGVDFLAANKTKEGVKVTESGLQYRVLSAGTGKMPTAASNVTVHYTGKLIDGTVFDSSVERGEPATFGVSQVISGWTEALQLMHVGDKWELYIPYELGYGDRGAGAQIPPFSTLIFEVELISVN